MVNDAGRKKNMKMLFCEAQDSEQSLQDYAIFWNWLATRVICHWNPHLRTKHIKLRLRTQVQERLNEESIATLDSQEYLSRL